MKQSGPPSMFAVFRRRNFTLLWVAQFISVMGNGMLTVAASLLVYRVTGSALSVGLMLLAASLPNLLVGLIAGVAADRFDRKRIMIGSNLICAVVVAVIPIFLPLGIGWLYFLVALSSAVEQFFNPAEASILPETAPEGQLAAANAMMTISLYGAVTIGSAVAGLIATYSSLNAALLLDALSFVLSGVCILLLRVAPQERLEHTTAASVWENLRTGLTFVRETPTLLSMVAVFGPVFIDYGLTNSLILPYVRRTMGGSEFHYSLVLTMFAAGFVAGSLLMAKLTDRLHAGQWIGISVLGMGASTAGMALAREMLGVLICATMIGMLNAPSYLGRQLLIQRTTPPEIRGRVNSVFMVLRDTAFIVGMASAGLADLFSVRMLMLINAAGLGVFGTVAFFLPGLGRPSARGSSHLAAVGSQA